MKDINGVIIDTDKTKGKILVLNYWFIKCMPCRREIPELNKLTQEYSSDPNVLFIAIALDNKKELQEFIKKTPFEYHIIPEGNKITSTSHINFFPTHVVVNDKGEIVFHCSESGDRPIYWIRKTIGECLKVNAK